MRPTIVTKDSTTHPLLGSIDGLLERCAVLTLMSDTDEFLLRRQAELRAHAILARIPSWHKVALIGQEPIDAFRYALDTWREPTQNFKWSDAKYGHTWMKIAVCPETHNDADVQEMKPFLRRLMRTR